MAFKERKFGEGYNYPKSLQLESEEIQMLFKRIGFWGSLCGVVLGLINCIMCIVEGIEVSKVKDIDFLTYAINTCYYTIMYKVSIAFVFLAIIMMSISYLVNTDGAKRVLMIICKGFQSVSICCSLIGFFIIQDKNFVEESLMVFAGLELLALILYIIDSDHRRTGIQVFVFSIATVGSGLFYLCVVIIAFVIAFFMSQKEETEVFGKDGKFIGWLRRE